MKVYVKDNQPNVDKYTAKINLQKTIFNYLST